MTHGYATQARCFHVKYTHRYILYTHTTMIYRCEILNHGIDGYEVLGLTLVNALGLTYQTAGLDGKWSLYILCAELTFSEQTITERVPKYI